MIFTTTRLNGAMLVDLEPREDERGFFARSCCTDEFERHGLCSRFVQCNISFSRKRGTLRGMHYQLEPHAEVKLVRCTAGAIYDVVVDLRPDSPTFAQHIGVTLTATNRRALYVPKGFAHGFQTLADNSEVFYQVSAAYHPASERGVRWNDEAFGIQWPETVTQISAKDSHYQSFELCSAS